MNSLTDLREVVDLVIGPPRDAGAPSEGVPSGWPEWLGYWWIRVRTGRLVGRHSCALVGLR